MTDSYLVGSQLRISVPAVTDILSNTTVDPATFAFRLVAPSSSGIPVATYSYNGASWTVSESVIGLPSRIGPGDYELRVTIPYVNTAQGVWSCGWKSTANGSGLGEGSGKINVLIDPSPVL